jgi:hypothetical protein
VAVVNWARWWFAGADRRAAQKYLQTIHLAIDNVFGKAVQTVEKQLLKERDGDIDEDDDTISDSASAMQKELGKKLTIDDESRQGLAVATAIIQTAWDMDHGRGNDGSNEVLLEDTAYVNKSLDALIGFFWQPLLSDQTRAPAKTLRVWEDVEDKTWGGVQGMLRLKQRQALLRSSSKRVFLCLALRGSLPNQKHVTMVVDRPTAFDDSIGLHPPAGPALVQPYFASTHGAKRVGGRRVEAGEGQGPRKDFFHSTAADATNKWSAPVAPSDDQVQCRLCWIEQTSSSGQSSASSFSFSQIKAGDQVLLALARKHYRVGDGKAATVVRRTVSRVIGPSKIMVDRPFDGSCWGVPVQENVSGTGLTCSIQVQQPRKGRPLLIHHRQSSCYWLPPSFSGSGGSVGGAEGSEAKEHIPSCYYHMGQMLVSAVANRCFWDMPLPPIFFHILLHYVPPAVFPPPNPHTVRGGGGADEAWRLATPTLDVVRRCFDAELAASMQKVLKMGAGQLVELVQAEGLDASTTPQQYVESAVRETLGLDTHVLSLVQGFYAALGSAVGSGELGTHEMLRQISPTDLQAIVCGSGGDDGKSDFNMRELFVVQMDEELMQEENAPLKRAFWSVIDELTPEKKRLFLKFAVGIEQLPEKGTEVLRIEMPFVAITSEDHRRVLKMLPQAHTCDNILELPNYREALARNGNTSTGRKLVEELKTLFSGKLMVAIEEGCVGYDLDALGSDGSGGNGGGGGMFGDQSSSGASGGSIGGAVQSARAVEPEAAPLTGLARLRAMGLLNQQKREEEEAASSSPADEEKGLDIIADISLDGFNDGIDDVQEINEAMVDAVHEIKRNLADMAPRDRVPDLSSSMNSRLSELSESIGSLNLALTNTKLLDATDSFASSPVRSSASARGTAGFDLRGSPSPEAPSQQHWAPSSSSISRLALEDSLGADSDPVDEIEGLLSSLSARRESREGDQEFNLEERKRLRAESRERRRNQYNRTPEEQARQGHALEGSIERSRNRVLDRSYGMERLQSGLNDIAEDHRQRRVPQQQQQEYLQHNKTPIDDLDALLGETEMKKNAGYNDHAAAGAAAAAALGRPVHSSNGMQQQSHNLSPLAALKQHQYQSSGFSNQQPIMQQHEVMQQQPPAQEDEGEDSLAALLGMVEDAAR